MTHLGEGLGLDLTDALPGDIEMSSHLVESGRLLIAQAVPHLDDGALPLVQTLQDELKVLDVELGGDQLEGAAASRASMKSPSMALSSPTGSKIETGSGGLRLVDFVEQPDQILRDSSLALGWLAAEAFG